MSNVCPLGRFNVVSFFTLHDVILAAFSDSVPPHSAPQVVCAHLPDLQRRSSKTLHGLLLGCLLCVVLLMFLFSVGPRGQNFQPRLQIFIAITAGLLRQLLLQLRARKDGRAVLPLLFLGRVVQAHEAVQQLLVGDAGGVVDDCQCFHVAVAAAHGRVVGVGGGAVAVACGRSWGGGGGGCQRDGGVVGDSEF